MILINPLAECYVSSVNAIIIKLSVIITITFIFFTLLTLALSSLIVLPQDS